LKFSTDWSFGNGVEDFISSKQKRGYEDMWRVPYTKVSYTDGECQVSGYCDADYAGDFYTRRSTTGSLRIRSCVLVRQEAAYRIPLNNRSRVQSSSYGSTREHMAEKTLERTSLTNQSIHLSSRFWKGQYENKYACNWTL